MDILVSELKKLNGLGEIRDGLNSYKNSMELVCYSMLPDIFPASSSSSSEDEL